MPAHPSRRGAGPCPTPPALPSCQIIPTVHPPNPCAHPVSESTKSFWSIWGPWTPWTPWAQEAYGTCSNFGHISPIFMSLIWGCASPIKIWSTLVKTSGQFKKSNPGSKPGSGSEFMVSGPGTSLTNLGLGPRNLPCFEYVQKPGTPNPRLGLPNTASAPELKDWAPTPHF